jgi:hypothetical protein
MFFILSSVDSIILVVLEESWHAWVARDGHFPFVKLFTAGFMAFMYLVACFRPSIFNDFLSGIIFSPVSSVRFVYLTRLHRTPQPTRPSRKTRIFGEMDHLLK